jgi:hypothetical protein
LRTNPHQFAQCASKSLIPERLTRYLLSDPVNGYTDRANQRLANTLVDDLF